MNATSVRPAPPPVDSWRHRTLADFLDVSVEKGAYEMGRTAWLARAMVTPLWQLGAVDLRLLLNHDRGAIWLIPELLIRLEQDPLTPVEGEIGALLLAACVVDPMSWASEPGWLARFAVIRRDARGRRTQWPPDMAAMLMDELDAADEVFAMDETASDM